MLEIIETIRQDLAAAFTGCSVYGLVYRNERDGETIPEAYTSGGDYIEVLNDDTTDGVIFFDVEPEREESRGIATARINVCFLLNLNKIYPTDDTRPTEKAHDQARDVLRYSPLEITGLITGISALSQFTVNDVENLNPYYIFEFKTKLNYNLNC